MDALMRMSGAVAALGAALIALAVGAAPAVLSTAPWIAVPMLAAGVGQAVLAVAAMRGSSLAAGAVLAPLALPTVAWLFALIAVPQAAMSLPMGPMLAESLLALGAAALLGARRRPSGEPKALPTVLSLIGSAAVVAVVATTALTGTHAGQFAVPHGEHGAETPGSEQPAQEDDAPLPDPADLEHSDH